MISAKVNIKDDRKEWDRMKSAVEKMSVKGGNAVDVGLFGEQGSDLVDYASKNEFGDPSNTFHGKPAPIPPRPFIRFTFDDEREKIGEQIDKAKLDVVLGKISKDRFLSRLGLWFQRKIVEKIDRSPEWAEPNKESTKLIKGSSHPLIDSGRMRQSITHRLVK